MPAFAAAVTVVDRKNLGAQPNRLGPEVVRSAERQGASVPLTQAAIGTNDSP
jgi:hypothetical protein